MKNKLYLLAIFLYFSAFGKAKNIEISQNIIIPAGKPTIIIVSVFSEESKNADAFFGKREFNELKDNFPDYEIKLITEHCTIAFENKNKDLIIASDPEENFEIVAFWDGKKDSAIKISKIKVKATEYISSITRQSKKSSYIEDNDKILADYKLKKTVFNPNENSKSLGQFYIIDMFFNKMVYSSVENLKPQDYTKVKSVIVYAESADGPEEIAFKMNFNDKHLVSDILYAKRRSSEGSVFMVFSYDDNNLLKKMIANENFNNEVKSTIYNYSYDDRQIIETSEDQYSVYSIQNNLLLTDYHYEFKDIATDFRIESSREEIKNGCKFSYEDGLIVKSYCPSTFENIIPYTYENTLYENNEPKRIAKLKLEKTANGTLSVSTFASSLNEYKEVGEITIGENGLTELVKAYSRGQYYTLRLEYK